MRMRGLEPPRPYGHTDLNRARLPIPPHPRGVGIVAPSKPKGLHPCSGQSGQRLQQAVDLKIGRVVQEADAYRSTRLLESKCLDR